MLASKLMGGLREFIHRFLQCLSHVSEVIYFLNLIIIILGIFFGFFEGIGPVNGIYFSYITALAIGYGDIVPQTGIGKILSIILGVIGIILFGIIVGISTRTVIIMMHPDGTHTHKIKGEKDG